MRPAFHRLRCSQDWRPVKIICALPYGQFLVEESDRPIPGRFAAFRSDLREPVGVFVYRERWGNAPAFVPRLHAVPA